MLEFLKLVAGKLDKSPLDDRQIDAIIGRLEVIKAHDPWTKKVTSKGGLPRSVTPNRGAVTRAILYMEIAHISNRFSKRPLRQRVTVEAPQKTTPHETARDYVVLRASFHWGLRLAKIEPPAVIT